MLSVAFWVVVVGIFCGLRAVGEAGLSLGGPRIRRCVSTAGARGSERASSPLFRRAA